ncbi:unnamed protein product [Lampetra planeri]
MRMTMTNLELGAGSLYRGRAHVEWWRSGSRTPLYDPTWSQVRSCGPHRRRVAMNGRSVSVGGTEREEDGQGAGSAERYFRSETSEARLQERDFRSET